MKKRINNVFISIGSNELKLVDIVFNEKIREIIPKSDRSIHWRDISDRGKRNGLIDKFPSVTLTPGIIDGAFNLLIPGAIDAHVHFNTPGFEEREDFEHGSIAAAYGGVTTVIDMPCTSLPPVTSKENFDCKLNALKNRSIIDYAFWGGVSGNNFDKGKNISTQTSELLQAGVCGFKTYMISGMESFTDLTDDQLYETARIIKSCNGIMAVHAEDKNLVQSRANQFINEGRNDWRAYCESRDINAEVTAVKKIIEISSSTGCRLHIVHLSSKEALNLIREAQKNGISITTETCPHYLYFTQHHFEDPSISSFLKTAPPVKMEEDREALWEGLKDGTISFVTTDHAGCDPQLEKTGSNFWQVYGGIPGVEHRVEFLFSEGLVRKDLTIAKIIDLLSANVADYFGINKKGRLQVDKDADMVLIDLWNSRENNSESMHSKGKYTPFHGVKFNSVVQKTILRGEVIMQEGKVLKDKMGCGKFVKPSHS